MPGTLGLVDSTIVFLPCPFWHHQPGSVELTPAELEFWFLFLQDFDEREIPLPVAENSRISDVLHTGAFHRQICQRVKKPTTEDFRLNCDKGTGAARTSTQGHDRSRVDLSPDSLSGAEYPIIRPPSSVLYPTAKASVICSTISYFHPYDSFLQPYSLSKFFPSSPSKCAAPSRPVSTPNQNPSTPQICHAEQFRKQRTPDTIRCSPMTSKRASSVVALF